MALVATLYTDSGKEVTLGHVKSYTCGAFSFHSKIMDYIKEHKITCRVYFTIKEFDPKNGNIIRSLMDGFCN